MPRFDDWLFDVGDLDQTRRYDETYPKVYPPAAGSARTGALSLYPGTDGGVRVLDQNGYPLSPPIAPPRSALERGAPEVQLTGLSTSVTLTTSYQNLTELAFPIASAGLYVFEYRFLVQRNSLGNGTSNGFTLGYSALNGLGVSFLISNYEVTTSSTALANQVVTGLSSTTSSYAGTASYLHVVDVEGYLAAGAPGTFVPRAVAATTNGTLVVQSASWGVIHRP